MIKTDDFSLFYSSDLIEDAKTVEKLLCNLDYSIASYRLSKQLDNRTEIRSHSVILILNSNDYKNLKSENIEFVTKTAILYLLKTIIPIEYESYIAKNILYYKTLIGNNQFAKKLFKLISYVNDKLNEYNKNEELKLYKETIRIYSDNNFADSYYEKWNNNLPLDKLDKFAQLVKPKGKILDSGCGPGHHTLYLSKLGFKTIGIDLSEAAIKIAKSHSTGATDFFVMDMLNTSFKDNSFDGVWSCAVLIHFPRNLVLMQLKEFYRVIKHHGILTISLLLNVKKHTDIYGRFFNNSFSVPDIKIIVEKVGFEVLGTENNISWDSTQQNLLISNWFSITLKKKAAHNTILRQTQYFK